MATFLFSKPNSKREEPSSFILFSKSIKEILCSSLFFFLTVNAVLLPNRAEQELTNSLKFVHLVSSYILFFFT